MNMSELDTEDEDGAFTFGQDMAQSIHPGIYGVDIWSGYGTMNTSRYICSSSE